MALVKVHMYATVREAAGTAETTLDVANLAEVFEMLGRGPSEALSSMLRSFSRNPEDLVVLVNGRNVNSRAARDVRLREGDDVSIFPPISGG